ncbi:MAG TPA: VWA domain-containing protein, partial [Dehalococcoidia bacterium]|nr:VWA domain-containing protein [Dehalococcoidia bacterium]
APFLLLLLSLLVPLAMWLRRPQRGAALRLPTLAPLAAIRPSWRLRLRPILPILRLIAAALIIVALARPQMGQANAVVENRGIDIVIAQDLSGSMTEPFGPQTGPGQHDTRLSAARRLAARFVDERKDDRIGLVVFESETRVMSPTTDDHDALRGIIQKLDTSLLLDGTAIGEGLSSAVNLLRGSTSRSRVIILITDGENNIHTVEPDEAAKLAKALGIRVYTIGIIDPRTNEVDVRGLKAIAEPTGGAFFPATSPSALGDVYQRINSMEKSTLQLLHFDRYDELAPWLVAPALVLLVIEVFLANTVFRRVP